MYRISRKLSKYRWDMIDLAIIIPAYKSQFLATTLESLASQTVSNFSVYVGNDAGGSAIEEIVDRFRDRLNISYTYFAENIGRTSLVKQWERCFTLLKDEQWIWILPDDDYADSNCVEVFLKHLINTDFDLYRFNVKFVDADGITFKENPPLPAIQHAFDSLLEKLSFFRPSTVAEFIFNRKKFSKVGFQELPMAWGTDDLLWYEMGEAKGIHGCNDAFVYLRQSELNISANYTTLGPKKIETNYLFFEKLLCMASFAKELTSPGKKKLFRSIALRHILHNLQDFSFRLPPVLMIKYAVKGNRIWNGGVLLNTKWLWQNNTRITKKLTL